MTAKRRYGPIYAVIALLALAVISGTANDAFAAEKPTPLSASQRMLEEATRPLPPKPPSNDELNRRVPIDTTTPRTYDNAAELQLSRVDADLHAIMVVEKNPQKYYHDARFHMQFINGEDGQVHCNHRNALCWTHVLGGDERDRQFNCDPYEVNHGICK